MKPFPLALVAAALAVGLVACGGSSPSTTPTTSSSIPTPDTASPPPPSALPSVPGQQSATLGQPFQVTSDNTTLSVTVDQVKCGPLDRKIMTAYYQSIGEQPQIPSPDRGNKWCILTAHAKNIGHVPLTAWSADVAILNAGQDSYNADTGSTIEQAYEDTSNGRGPEYGLNPNASGPDYAVYQIPTTATPTAVTVPTSDNGGSAIVTLGG